jgi:hypothetical protein
VYIYFLYAHVTYSSITHNTNIYAPGGIRTLNPSRRVTTDLRPRPRGFRHRQCNLGPPVLWSGVQKCEPPLYPLTSRAFTKLLLQRKSNTYYIFLYVWVACWCVGVSGFLHECKRGLLACRLTYLVCHAQTPYCLLPFWLHHIFRHYLSVSTIFGEKSY